MAYISSIILFIESALSFYKFFIPKSFMGPSFFDLILGVVFLILGIISLKKYQNRVFQWVTIIFSVIMGPGGFIGIGGLSALLLAVYFIFLSKNLKKTI